MSWHDIAGHWRHKVLSSDIGSHGRQSIPGQWAARQEPIAGHWRQKPRSQSQSGQWAQQEFKFIAFWWQKPARQKSHWRQKPLSQYIPGQRARQKYIAGHWRQKTIHVHFWPIAGRQSIQESIAAPAASAFTCGACIGEEDDRELPAAIQVGAGPDHSERTQECHMQEYDQASIRSQHDKVL